MKKIVIIISLFILSFKIIGQNNETNKAEAAATRLTLTRDGSLRDTPALDGEILQSIPAGEAVVICWKDAGYYKVYYGGKIGYLDEIFFANTNSSKPVSYSESANDTNKKEVVASRLTLTRDGLLRNTPALDGEILQGIPAGEVVVVCWKDAGYYKVYYGGKIGYIDEIFFTTTNNSKPVSYSNPSNDAQRKECKVYYINGETIQYYVYKGISISMQLSIVQYYGKYYTAKIAIENLSGESFNFDPKYITAILENKGKSVNGVVLSSDEYMSIVGGRQALREFLVAFGESYSANNAGYSSSSTSVRGSYYSNSYYGNTHGNIYGTINTQSYDAAAAYAAQQNASQNISNFQDQQFKIKEELNQGYLKLNTIANEERLIGQIRIKFKNATSIKIIVPVNGEGYEFWWTN